MEIWVCYKGSSLCHVGQFHLKGNKNLTRKKGVMQPLQLSVNHIWLCKICVNT